MKKNILFISHDSSLFGANQSLMNMMSSLKDQGVNSKAVFPERGPVCEHLDNLGIDYFIVKYKTESVDPHKSIKSKILNFLRLLNKSVLNRLALTKLHEIVKLNNINIIHSNSSIVTIGEELAKKEMIRHVWHVREYIDLDHGMDVFGGVPKLKNRIRKSDKVICISESILNYFELQNNSIVLYNSVRKIANPFQSGGQSNYFLFCGSLIKNKGAEEAIKAFYAVYQQNNTLKLWIAGIGEYQYEIYLKNLVSQLKIEGNVEFLGFRKDTDELMSNALAFLMCSKSEALGRVTIEAMLNSCLVIGFNNAGTAELIKNDLTGFLYSNEEEMTEHMLKIANNKSDNFEQIRLKAYNYACDNFLEKQYGVSLINYYDSFCF